MEEALVNEEPERKLVAILAADMVGFTHQLGRDEAGTLARLDRARRGVIDPAIAAQRGRIFKEMGDGILAEFPSAVLALRAAIAIQTALADRRRARADEDVPDRDGVMLRIGVHQGEAVIAGADLLGGHRLRYEREELAIDPEATGTAHRTFVGAAGRREIFGAG